jgi:predicted nucleotidyltransferase component of viral defense system
VFVDALPAGTRANLALLSETSLADPFYLAGGTAAALYLGHRISVDLDFFGPDPFDSSLLAGQLADLGQFRLDRIAPDTLLGELAGVKISFFRYRYPLLAAPSVALGARIASLPDIAAMKLDAVSRRGTKRDFVDLFFVAQSGLSMSEGLMWYQRKYAGLDVNVVHVVKSLAYFVDAELDPSPRMLVDYSWDKVKRFFEQEAKSLLKTL